MAMVLDSNRTLFGFKGLASGVQEVPWLVPPAEDLTMPLSAGSFKRAAGWYHPWAESRVRNLKCVVAAGVQPEDQFWPWWPLLPITALLLKQL